ncbi:hypothetical protein LOC51_18370 [Rubrivivax sp. JA1024]|nr:hypothetical protein [Rubrivivax sp. JA1024]
MVDQDDVEAQILERLQQLRGASRTQDQLDIGAAEQRPQKRHLKVARQRRQRSDAQRLPRDAGVAKRADQLVAGRDDRIGVIEGDAARLGQMQLAAAAFEQRMTELLLELADLNRQRRLREIQPLCSPRQVAVVGDGPEVTQVIEIQLDHTVR